MNLEQLKQYGHSMELHDWQAQQLGGLLHQDKSHLNLLNAALQISVSSGKISEACRKDLFEMAFRDKIEIKKDCESLVVAISLILAIIE